MMFVRRLARNSRCCDGKAFKGGTLNFLCDNVRREEFELVMESHPLYQLFKEGIEIPNYRRLVIEYAMFNNLRWKLLARNNQFERYSKIFEDKNYKDVECSNEIYAIGASRLLEKKNLKVFV